MLDIPRWLWLATHAAHDLWDDESWESLCSRQVRLGRQAGALTMLVIALSARVGFHLYAGELAEAALLVEEVEAVSEAMVSRFPRYGARRARRVARAGGRRRRASRCEPGGGDGARRGDGMDAHPQCRGRALQRPRPLRGGAERGRAGGRASGRARLRDARRCPSWSRRPSAAGRATAPRPPSNGSPKARRLPALTGHWGCWRAAERC